MIPGASPKPATYGPGPRRGVDLARVLNLPRRVLRPGEDAPGAWELERSLRLAVNAGECLCRSVGWAACPISLRPVQVWALLEASKHGGLFAPIGVGWGKELLCALLGSVLGVESVGLMIPESLRAQVTREWEAYGRHWKLPTLAPAAGVPGSPRVTLISYEALSRMETRDVLEQVNPGALILNEAHRVSSLKSARTIRLLEFARKRPGLKVCATSATFTRKSIRDGAHLAAMALKFRSPYPLDMHTVEEWAGALDPSPTPAPPGALVELCDEWESRDTESVRRGFARRRNETPGVVATSEESLTAGLVIRRVTRSPLSARTMRALTDVRALARRPDGEEFSEQSQVTQCAKQLAAGFFHYWAYPNGESADVIEAWFQARQEWNRAVRRRLGRPSPGMDSPGLLTRAALRAVRGYRGPRPVWPCPAFPAWHSIHRKVRPVPSTEWMDDGLVNFAADWARRAPGIVWTEYPTLGKRIAEAAGIGYFGAVDGGARVMGEDGARSIVAAIRPLGTGANLQRWSRNLVLNPPTDAAAWEQLLGRTHRQGQQADEVTVEVMAHTAELAACVSEARALALFRQQIELEPQRLLLATWL